jgi:hypothetical protein
MLKKFNEKVNFWDDEECIYKFTLLLSSLELGFCETDSYKQSTNGFVTLKKENMCDIFIKTTALIPPRIVIPQVFN